jgi:hypothetical protein
MTPTHLITPCLLTRSYSEWLFMFDVVFSSGNLTSRCTHSLLNVSELCKHVKNICLWTDGSLNPLVMFTARCILWYKIFGETIYKLHFLYHYWNMGSLQYRSFPSVMKRYGAVHWGVEGNNWWHWKCSLFHKNASLILRRKMYSLS